MNWAKEKFKVNFPIFEKVDVIGEDADNVWKFLASKSNTQQRILYFLIKKK